MKGAEYWRERFKKLEEMQHAGAVRSYEEIEKLYRRTLHEVEKEIREWYFRFAENNQIPLNEAYRLLNTEELEELKWTVEEYIRYGKKNAVSEAWMGELENASAKAHVNRLEALRLQLQQSAEVLFGNQLDIIDTMLRESYLSSYMHTAYEIQRGVGVAWNLATPDTRLIEKVLGQPWAADGRAYSDRIWSNKQKLLHELNTTLTQNIISGADPQKAIDTIARRMNVSKQAAGRLVMTEEAAISNAAQKECFQELGVEEYEIIETLDLLTCETCGDLDKQRFPMDKHEIGVTAPPFHPNCRGCTAPYIDDDFDVPGKRFARGADGKGYYVQDMSYKEWRKTYVEEQSDRDNGKPYVDVIDTWRAENKDDAKLDFLEKYNVDGETYVVDGKHVILDYSEKEKNVAELLLGEFGGNMQIVPRVVYPQGKTTPDYIYNGEKYDLKEPRGESRHVLYNMVAKKKTQAQNFIFDIGRCPLNERDIMEQINELFHSRHTGFIDKIILIKDKDVIGVYERK